MLFSPEENRVLTSTGADTPMGALLRRYWIPALVADEIEPDGPQKRVRVLGEDLIAFRDSDGRPGVLDEYCPHRRASLYFARNEECGLRCAYHGWKFDVTGLCVDLPSERDYASWAQPMRVRSYPAAERGGIVWIYMGPPEKRPPLPEYEFTLFPDSHRRLQRRLHECNWLQALEGGLDPVHVPFLHRYQIRNDPIFGNNRSADFMTGDYEVVYDGFRTEGGVLPVSRRDAGGGETYWRFGQWVMPFLAQAPPYGVNPVLNSSIWVPVDDESCFRYNIASHPTRPLTAAEHEAFERGGGNQVEVDPVTLRTHANRDNDYMMDREGQRERKTYSGVYGFALQDQAIQENQEVILDRSRESLVAADRNLIMTRRFLLEAALALESEGKDPPGLDARSQRVRGASVLAPDDWPVEKVIAQGILVSEPGVPIAST